MGSGQESRMNNIIVTKILDKFMISFVISLNESMNGFTLINILYTVSLCASLKYLVRYQCCNIAHRLNLPNIISLSKLKLSFIQFFFLKSLNSKVGWKKLFRAIRPYILLILITIKRIVSLLLLSVKSVNFKKVFS